MIRHPPISTLFPYTTLFRSSVSGTTVSRGTGTNMVFGDGGEIRFAADGTIDQAFSTNVGIGGADKIYLGAGSNLAVGGADADLINGGDGSAVVLGDSGIITGITAALGAANQFGHLPLTLGRIETLSDNTGGNDTITVGGTGTNVILGGAANDTITAGDGTNLVFGDGGAIQFDATGSFIDYAISTFTDGSVTNPAIGGDDGIVLGNGSNLVVGGAGEDTITTGTGTNIALGDNGSILSPHNNLHQFGTLKLTLFRIFTVADAIGGVDTIKTSQVGESSNIVLGGAKGDLIWASASVSGTTVSRGTGTNMVFGDGGEIRFAADGTIERAFSTSEAIGGADKIYLGAGSNLVVGGADGDTINGGDGSSVVLGDSGIITGIPAALGAANQFGHLPLTLGRIETLSDNTGGNDTITVGNGTNVILGGVAVDTITAGNGTNLVFGDGGAIQFDSTGSFIDYAISTFTDGSSVDPASGGDDTIKTSQVGESSNIVLGGAKGDVIWASASVSGTTVSRGTGTNMVFGDGGEIRFAADGTIDQAFSTNVGIGGADKIYLGAGSNLAVGGADADLINGGDGSSVVLGDSGIITGIPAALGAANQFGHLPLTLGRIETLADNTGGNDTITVGNGTTVILGGVADDKITAGNGT